MTQQRTADADQEIAALGPWSHKLHLSDGPPFMAFLEGDFAGDPANWWAPNRGATCALPRSAGFRIIGRPGHDICLCRRGPGVRQRPADPREHAAATGRPPDAD